MNDIERRVFTLDRLQVERREKDASRIVGHAAVFNQAVSIGGWFNERVAAGAFSRAIKEDDVRALFNHDPNLILGRNKAGTLALSEDETGLMTVTVPPDTTYARDLMVSMERGDVTQMSFGFFVRKQEWDETGDVPLRTLLEVELFDVSPVTFPAYPTTDVGLRTLEAYRKEHPKGAPTTVRAAPLVQRERVQRLRERQSY